MNDLRQDLTDPASRDPRRVRRLIVILIGVAALLIAVPALLMIVAMKLQPARLAAGEVIDRPGTYRSPSGNGTVSIEVDASGNAVVTKGRKARRYYVIPYTRLVASHTFESERDWFVSVDRYDRLWVYRGRWEREWGELRQMPSGGTTPFAPAVLMYGGWFSPTGRPLSGEIVVSATGAWAGVPQAFFDRIPGKEAAQWAELPIPSSAPRLTRRQHDELLRRSK